MTSARKGETMAQEAAVEIDALTVSLDGGRRIVDAVDLSIAPGRILGLVGESGSGKTTVGMALLGFVRQGAGITAGRVVTAGQEVGSLDAASLRALRRRGVSYVPQDPRAAFNPALRIGAQLRERIAEALPDLAVADREERAVESLRAVGLPGDEEFLARFPHQLSGGQLQRVGIALAIAPRPRVVVWDEPTTGLDVITQRRILDLVRSLCSEHGIAGLYVTHDLAVLPAIADELAVMRSGTIVERGTVEQVLRSPQHAYTRELLAAIPGIDPVGSRATRAGAVTGAGRADADAAAAPPSPVLEVAGLSASYHGVPVLRRIDFTVASGECVAVVGESGSGKTTLSRSIIGLHEEYRGAVSWHGSPIAARAARRTREERRALQYVFQSPHAAFNPRATILESLLFAGASVRPGSRSDQASAAREALRSVGLDPAKGDLLPARLSGGERQRAAIARALVAEPSLIICDEITSALDVIVQRRIMDLLMELRERTGLSFLFVTHNLALVSDIADRVLVLEDGAVAESGSTASVLGRPRTEYVKSLVAHTPTITTGPTREERS